MRLLAAHSKPKAKGDKHACLGFASLPKGEVDVCLGNVHLKKLKTHNKKLVSRILCPYKQNKPHAPIVKLLQKYKNIRTHKFLMEFDGQKFL